MKVQVGRVTVHGKGLEARRFADRLAQDLHHALARALSGAPPHPEPVEQAARAIAQRLKDEIALRWPKP